MWVLYIAVSMFVGIAVTISVLKSVREMTPERPPSVGAPLDIGQCQALARNLFGELDAQRQHLSGAAVVKRVDADWTRFRARWLASFRDAESRCDTEAADRAKVKASFDALEKVADLYTTHAVQFAGEVGPALDALHAALGAEAGAAQLPGSTTP